MRTATPYAVKRLATMLPAVRTPCLMAIYNSIAIRTAIMVLAGTGQHHALPGVEGDTRTTADIFRD